MAAVKRMVLRSGIMRYFAFSNDQISWRSGISSSLRVAAEKEKGQRLYHWSRETRNAMFVSATEQIN